MMRVAVLLLASALLAAPVSAQVVAPLTGSTGVTTSVPPSAAPPAAAPATPRRTHRSLAERFDAANTTHDGKLTLSQARAGHMNAVARDFAKIDKANKGYVTMDDIRAYNRARRAANRSRTATPE